MRQVKRWTGTMALVLALVGLILGAMQLGNVQAAEEPYKVGVVCSITGTGSFLGEPEKKTVEMIAEDVNKKGGINGHPLELVVYDDESDATKCNLAVKKLIKTDKVPVILGPSRSGESLAVVSVAEEAKVPLISMAASYKIVSPIESRKWVFKVAGSDSHVVAKMYDYMKAKGWLKIGIMTDSTGFGSSGREELLRLAPEYGITILADERFGDKDSDLSAQLTKIRSTQPQAIVNWSIGPTQVLSIKTWRRVLRVAAGDGDRRSGAPPSRPDAKRANLRSPFELAEWTGLEPATPGVTGRYSNQLNYHSRTSRAVYPSSPAQLVGADGIEPPTFAL